MAPRCRGAPALRFPGSALERAQRRVVISSIEPKAAETSRILARSLGISHETALGLHDHDRAGVPLYPERQRFEERVAECFAHPDRLVLGRETLADARHRFAAALDRIASERQGDDLVVVSHGTVIAAHVARRAALDAFALWRRLGLPSYVVLSLPEGELLAVVEEP
jgi:broad specificity phosphatase PhoE